MAGQPPGDPNRAYPPPSYPPQPPTAPGYPPQTPGYSPEPGYAPQGPGYPAPGYPQGPGYPPQVPGYAPPGPGYPPQVPGYPPAGYPPYGYAPQVAVGPVYATFARRFGAMLIDWIGLAIVVAIVGVAARLPGFETTTTNGSTSFAATNSGWSALVFGLVGAIYFIGSWSYLGATPAQKMLGLRVCQASGPVPLTLNAAAIRWAVLIGVASGIGAISIAVPSTAGILGFGQLVWIIVLAVTTYQSPTRQGFHDQAAGSVVVHG